MPCLCGENLFWAEKLAEASLTYPTYSKWANFLYISSQNLGNRLHQKQEVGRLEGWHVFQGNPPL